MGRNPRTGDQVPVPERRVVTFRPGKKMKELIANSKPGEKIESPPDTSPPDTTSPSTPPTSGENPEYRPPTM